MVVVVMIGKIMFMMEMIVMKLNEEEAEEFIGGFTLQFTVVVVMMVVVVFMMNYEMLFVKHQAMIFLISPQIHQVSPSSTGWSKETG